MNDKPYRAIIEHYERCLEEHGDTHRGVDWPKAEDVETRYRVMLDVIQSPDAQNVSLLDFGCGLSHLYEYIQKKGLNHIAYSGMDISDKFVGMSRRKFPHLEYYCFDILEDDASLPQFDYIVMNGVFTEKRELGDEAMWAYFDATLSRVFAHAKAGIAFNVMSKQVDWERDDLFHVSFDRLAAMLTQKLSRHFVIRHDYRLYEYTVYVYR